MCWDAIKDSDCRVINGVKYWSYWPEMEHIDQLIDLWERDEYTFLSQYQQSLKRIPFAPANIYYVKVAIITNTSK